MHRISLLLISRWIFGLFYFATGVWIALAQFGLSAPPPQPTPAASAFTNALTASRFVDPLIAVAYLFGGGALLLRRTSPVGVLLLAPIVVVIFFFHLVLSGQWVWGTINLLWLAALAWSHRTAYTPLWNYPHVPAQAAATRV